MSNNSMREFSSGSTRDTDEGKYCYEGFLSPLVLQGYQETLEKIKATAWAAGLFEGEGCITEQTHRPRKQKNGTVTERPKKYPMLCINVTDEDSLQRFAEAVGVGKVNGPYFPKNRKPVWRWSATGQSALIVARQIMPYLGKRRLNRLREVFGMEATALMSGFSPMVLSQFGEYMHKHRVQADGKLRAPDNWQKHFGEQHFSVCMDSLLRHLGDMWLEHRGFKSREGIENAMMGVLFNVQAYADKYYKDRLK